MIGESLPRTDGDRIVLSGALWNRLVDRIERLERLAAAPPLMLSDNGAGRVLSLARDPRAVRRMRVTDASPAPGIVLARKWNGATDSGPELAVKSHRFHAYADEILAAQPAGGTDRTYAGAPVTWEALLDGGIEPLWGTLAAAWPGATNQVTLTPCAGPLDNTPTGAANITAYIQIPLARAPAFFAAEVGDILGCWATAGVHLLIAAPLPYGGAQYDVLQLVTPTVGGIGPLRAQ